MRVLLRTPHEGDRDEFIAAMRASEQLHYPWMTGVRTPVEFARLIERTQDERFDPSFVCRLEDGAIVGFLTWIWMSLMVVLLGAEFNSEIENAALGRLG